MDLVGKKVRVNYSISDFNKFLTGIVVEEDEIFISVRGLKDGSIFRIAKNTIHEIVQMNGDGKS